MALFIVFEGGEGCGKSTQTRALYRRLSKSGFTAVLTREPGGTSLGERVRRHLKQTDGTAISPMAELFLIAAARAQLVSEVIHPALKAGQTVVCDRFTFSTLAYQGYGRRLPMDTLRVVNDAATGGLSPDLVVLLDVPVGVGLSRKKLRGRDRFESENRAFHSRVRRGYLEMARADPQRWLVVNGRLPRGLIGRKIWERVSSLLRRESNG
ncbi:MAG: dTMP kinase [Dehalococcoidia bacterium]|nr:dTMP kinase [Dehalococcoidia bacterium]